LVKNCHLIDTLDKKILKMNDRNNKTSICSIVFLDIIDYSKKTDSEQIEIKNQFNALINHALKDVAENDRIILDTGDGAAIASNGSPEDVLFIALNIRDEILKSNIHSAMPLYVRFGVNLGPVRVVKDINGRPNIIGDGINVAQRIMSFAKPNQILVSRSYYEVTSRLTQEISQMFDYSGIKQDKHVREHEVYSVRLLKEQADNIAVPSMPVEDLAAAPIMANKKINWQYIALAAPAIVAFFLIIQSAYQPVIPKITLDPSVTLAQPNVRSVDSVKTDKNTRAIENRSIKNTSNSALMPNETLESVPLATTLAIAKKGSVKEIVSQDKAPDELLAIELAKKKAKQKAKKKVEDVAQQNTAEAKSKHGSEQHQEVVVAKTEVKKEVMQNRPSQEKSGQEKSGQEKSGWSIFKDSVKKGGEVTCTQAQVAMNQCN
jgi:class 3 adenylate cyclase